MIYPTRSAIWIAVAGVPVTLLLALIFPGRWYAALAWPAVLLLLVLVDALRGSRPGQAECRLDTPDTAHVGTSVELTAHVTIRGAAPATVEIALAPGPLLELSDSAPLWIGLNSGKGDGRIMLKAGRRGTAHIAQVWLRWRGPLGLVWKQRRFDLEQVIAVMPDLRALHDSGARLFQRHSLQGLVAQINRGDGTDFENLVEFQSGMDKRAIDWKQSARHVQLLAKEFRTERNNQIVFAVDSGRQMCEPIAGLARLDRIVSAMLLTGWIALKLGDRVALHSFDARPRIASGLISGAGAFGELQRLAAQIDYSGEETNYTHALATLSARLNRRSMIVLFTEFTDLASAEFLVRAASKLVERHLLLIVVLRDEELEAIRARAPQDADDVTRAVTAASLLRVRLTVLTQLRHLGAHIVESEYDRVPERLVQAYVDLKRRNLL